MSEPDKSSGSDLDLSPGDKLPSDQIAKDVAEKVPSLKSIPQQDRERVIEFVAHEVMMMSGPLPPPALLAGYGDVDPEIPKIIVEMAQANQNHIIEMQKREIAVQDKKVKLDFIYSITGQIFGLISTLFCLALVGFLAVQGHPNTAAIIGGVGIVSLATAFIVGRKSGGSNPDEAARGASNHGARPPASRPRKKR